MLFFCLFAKDMKMSKQAAILHQNIQATGAVNPVIIVGTGPVGIRAAYELIKREPNCTIYMYGGEPWIPYDRVALSSVLAGDLEWSSIDNQLHVPATTDLVRYDNCPVTRIDRENKRIIDCEFREQPYSHLILATGSSPHIPSIPGVGLAGVYTFRNRNDVQSLMARRARSRRTVVLGGGLLGLEAARAMQQHNTEVTLIEHSTRLMSNQLDESAAIILRERIMALGINVILGNGVKSIIGDTTVNGLQLQDGRIVHCDTIILATGIRPNIELARDCGLSIGRGIRVNDQMLTSDPYIYAVGECAEHRDTVYGLVSPGLEQSAVAAHSITGGSSTYAGSLLSTSLKVVGTPVFTAGDADTEQDRPALRKNITYENTYGHIYRKIVVENSRLTGAIGIGDWPEKHRILEFIRNKKRLWPWQVQRFMKTGFVWSDADDDSVSSWPASTTVCNCKGITRGQLSDTIEAGCNTVDKLMCETGASTVCGSCRHLISNLVGETLLENPGTLTRPLLVISLLAVLLAVLTGISPPVPYTTSVSLQADYDMLWRDGVLRQVSGFTLLGLSVFLMLLPLRKRWKKFQFGSYINWRLVHSAIGLMLLLALLVHTGLRLGENLNFMLITTYLGALIAGGLAGITAHMESQINTRTGKLLRGIANKLHLYVLWPAPVLITFHILSVYYF
jgi:nitrite reductase (NADH) large subunit